LPALLPEETVETADGLPVKVISYIGEGSQGEIYKVFYNGGMYALKWYKLPKPADVFYENLRHNIENGSPNEHFLWPQQITKGAKGSFGYIMDLLPERYRAFSAFLQDKVHFSNWTAMISAAMNIVEGFRILHSGGYCYQDLNEGAFFIDPKNGDVLICDNDNVAPVDAGLGIKGTPFYMAPEIVANDSSPDPSSDRFSLAVILFRLFYINHPLEGRYTLDLPLGDGDNKMSARAFGKKPVFIYDPIDDSNRPVHIIHESVISRWSMYPPDLAASFMAAFTDGMKDENKRLFEIQWIETLVKVRGMLVKTGGRERFVNAYRQDGLPEGIRVMRFPGYVVALGPDSKLYKRHTDQQNFDYQTVTGIVKQGSVGVGPLVLYNLSGTEWTTLSADGDSETVQHNGFVTLSPGLSVNFGHGTDTIGYIL
jgi:DNA-binding helix-hairpin-helix protein with protein kinase domain